MHTGASVRGGRGASRGMASNRSDPFRSRPPNTSRPPSMHVDDFNKLQKTSQQLMGPTGISRRPEKVSLCFDSDVIIFQQLLILLKLYIYTMSFDKFSLV